MPNQCKSCGMMEGLRAMFQMGGIPQQEDLFSPDNQLKPSLSANFNWYKPTTAPVISPNIPDTGQPMYRITGDTEASPNKFTPRPIEMREGQWKLKDQRNQKIDPFFAIQGATNWLSWLSGIQERNRQNQYDYQQQTALGMMNPMSTMDFQPNPYSLYARYGGSLRKHLINLQHSFSNDAEMRMDKYREMQEGGMTGDSQIEQIVSAYAQITNTSPDQIMQMLQQMNPAQQQTALKKMVKIIQKGQQGQQAQQQPMQQMGGYMGQDVDMYENEEMKKGGKKWIQKAVNPAHKGWCTPMTKSTCTGARRRFALLMKRKHGFHKKEDGGYYQAGGQLPSGYHYMPDGTIMSNEEMKKGGKKWIQKAVNPAHKGWCTPMTKPTCTGRRRQFALMMKRKHGFHQTGGYVNINQLTSLIRDLAKYSR